MTSKRHAREVFETAKRKAHVFESPHDYLAAVEDTLDELAPGWRAERRHLSPALAA